MKWKSLFVTTALILGLVCISNVKAQAQNSFELQVQGAKPGNYVTLKGYDIHPGKKYPYIFSNLSAYKIKIKHGHHHVGVRVLDKNNEEVASNFNPNTHKYNKVLAFTCGETGTYYIQFENIKN